MKIRDEVLAKKSVAAMGRSSSDGSSQKKRGRRRSDFNGDDSFTKKHRRSGSKNSPAAKRLRSMEDEEEYTEARRTTQRCDLCKEEFTEAAYVRHRDLKHNIKCSDENCDYR